MSTHSTTTVSTTPREKPKCLIIYTGGTIGMIRDAATNTLVPASSELPNILKQLPEFYTPEIPAFDVYVWPQLYDSSDMTPVQYIQLCNDIRDNYDKYNGFVILHGTDTLAYTASVLSFMLENLNKPVILTGSMIPLSHSISDAKRNLLISLVSCCSYPCINDVCIYFNNTLIRGNRAHKSDPGAIDAFNSMNVSCLATMGVHIQIHNDTQLPTKHTQYPFSISTQLYDIGNIFVMLYTPGLNTNLLKAIFEQSTQQQPIALVLSLFGAGNAPTLNKHLLDVLQYGISERYVEIVVCSQCTTGTVDMLQYATGLQMHQLGSICAIDMTVEAIVGKLMYLMGKGYRQKQLKLLMESNLRGELTSKHGYGDHTLIQQNGCIPTYNSPSISHTNGIVNCP